MTSLVRDGALEWIKETKDPRTVFRADKSEMPGLLGEKLQEEVRELLSIAPERDEIADVIEICVYIGQYTFDLTRDQVFALVEEKRKLRGGFDKCIVIERT